MKQAPNRLTIGHLTHEHTPAELADINERLCELLNADETDVKALQAEVDKRDSFIVNWLSQLTDKKKKQFALNESQVNNKLTCICKDLLNTVEKDLLKLNRGRKAVKSYTK
ncbi:hypothetical protein [Gayadomonas joobiniege]|uniref:hypothetical protein n=1 Tax=Gayadomonas joobiniege TaxID=1234606 RepID=UPI000366FE0C|nr:hypothetical protein [Gayadomonas joobiniege]